MNQKIVIYLATQRIHRVGRGAEMGLGWGWVLNLMEEGKFEIHRATALAATIGDRTLFVVVGWAGVHWSIYRAILSMSTGLI
jgi:hypothetical protein